MKRGGGRVRREVDALDAWMGDDKVGVVSRDDTHLKIFVSLHAIYAQYELTTSSMMLQLSPRARFYVTTRGAVCKRWEEEK